ncbi:indole-3-butyric acid response 5 [Wolffia australiana]
MRKRERENPCGVCGHYHDEAEVCGICGHRPTVSAERTAVTAVSSAFPSEIWKDFLYLGSYDNACRGELLRTQGISRVLNTVPACQNLYKNSFTYHCLQDDKVLPFDDAFLFLEQCERDKARVLVHCMSGRSRSPAIVIAYLMRSKGWRLDYSLNWVKERRPSVDLFPAVYQQLLDYEQKLFSPHQTFGFGVPRLINPASAVVASVTVPPSPSFQTQSTSIFDRASAKGNPGEFVFRAGLIGQQRVNATGGAEAPMDSC